MNCLKCWHSVSGEGASSPGRVRVSVDVVLVAVWVAHTCLCMSLFRFDCRYGNAGIMGFNLIG